MTFVAPFALGLTALAAPIVLLYMLRSRRARTPVSSTMLWRLDEQSVSAARPWQPLRWSLVLLLQLLTLLLIALAIARPARSTELPLSDHTVMIIDTSASMQTRHGSGSRLDEAKRRALQAVSQLGDGKRMSVVEAGPNARVVLSGATDKRALEQAIEGLRASDGRTDAGSAFALGASLESADVPTILHLYSDGGVMPEDRAEIPANLVHIPIGTPMPNIAVQRISVASGAQGIDAYVRLANAGPQTVDAALVLEVNETQLLRRTVRLPARSTQDVTLTAPKGSGSRFTAKLLDARASSGSDEAVDGLSIDNVARATVEGEGSLRVLLATPGNLFLESFVKSIPGAQLTVTEKPASLRGFALAIYDRVALPPKLEVPTIAIEVPGGAPGVAVSGRVRRPVITFVQPREPILEQVDLSRVAIRRAQRLQTSGMRTLVAAGDNPLLAAGLPQGERLAYLAFDLRQSNLPVQVAYPLLFGNLVSWLVESGGGDRGALVAGDALPLRVPGQADRVVVTLPTGELATRTAARVSFDDTERAGFYNVRYLAKKDLIAEEIFAVGVPATESSLDPKALGARPTGNPGGGRKLAGLRSVGPGLLAAALLVLLVEWWIAHGRPTPRRRYDRRFARA